MPLTPEARAKLFQALQSHVSNLAHKYPEASANEFRGVFKQVIEELEVRGLWRRTSQSGERSYRR